MEQWPLHQGESCSGWNSDLYIKANRVVDTGKHAAGVTCTAPPWYTGIWGVSGADTDAGNPSQPTHKIKDADTKWETDAAPENRWRFSDQQVAWLHSFVWETRGPQTFHFISGSKRVSGSCPTIPQWVIGRDLWSSSNQVRQWLCYSWEEAGVVISVASVSFFVLMLCVLMLFIISLCVPNQLTNPSVRLPICLKQMISRLLCLKQMISRLLCLKQMISRETRERKIDQIVFLGWKWDRGRFWHFNISCNRSVTYCARIVYLTCIICQMSRGFISSKNDAFLSFHVRFLKFSFLHQGSALSKGSLES